MSRQRGGRQFHRPRTQQPGRRGVAPQQQRQRAGRHRFDDARHGKVGAEHVAHRQVHGGDQPGRLQRHVHRLDANQRHRAPGCYGGRAADHGAELGGKRPRQQHQEQHPAQRHGLADDHQAMQQDPDIADQVYEAVHAICCS